MLTGRFPVNEHVRVRKDTDVPDFLKGATGRVVPDEAAPFSIVVGVRHDWLAVVMDRDKTVRLFPPSYLEVVLPS